MYYKADFFRKHDRIMADTVSRSSVDSSSIGDEFVVVNSEPKLRMVDGDSLDLETKMSEVLGDDSTTVVLESNGQPKVMTDSMCSCM